MLAMEPAADLIESRKAFVDFVERRVGDRALADEIVQEALVKNLDKLGEIRENAVGWFYRVLRNAIVDRARREAVRARRLEAYAAELEHGEDEELGDAVCACLRKITATLKPEFRDALERIDMGDMPVKDYAAVAGITANAAGVRVFRARAALRDQVQRACGTCATHGCFQCECGDHGTESETR